MFIDNKNFVLLFFKLFFIDFLVYDKVFTETLLLINLISGINNVFKKMWENSLTPTYALQQLLNDTLLN